MSVTISGDSGLAGAATGALNGTLGATTPSTVAATTGTFSGNVTAPNLQGPAFSVYLNTPLNTSSGVYTKIPFDAEDFDTNNNFDTTTNRRFTPTVAGYYQFNLTACPYTSAGTSEVFLAFYKNGTLYSETRTSGVTNNYNLESFSSIIYCNGSSDYIEFYIKGGSQALVVWGGSGFTYTRVSGFLARSA